MTATSESVSVDGVSVEDGQVGASRRRSWLDWSALRRWLRPLGSGPQEIAALDGLRALAALSVLAYHATATAGAKTIIAGHDLTWTYFYTESGVDLFFVLSGFLLFMPYARDILGGRAAPAAGEFYRRRALRILPAYYVCLGALTLTQLSVYTTPMGVQNILAHLFLLHDIFPPFNRTISGPFWTLAVEWQFYLMLPLIAWVIGRVSRGSPRRLIASVLGVITLALGLRWIDALATTSRAIFPPNALTWIDLAQRIVIGSQGKYLEVFGVGMLCSVIYTLARSRPGALAGPWTQRAGLALLALALLIYLTMGPLVYIRRNAILAAYYLALRPSDQQMLAGPLLLGIGYGALTLGVLLAPRWTRAPFEWGPLRFIGLISYSLYLWHESIINWVFPMIPITGGFARGVVALAVGFGVAIPFAYVSYQLVERPFLRLRRAGAKPAKLPSATSSAHISRDHAPEVTPEVRPDVAIEGRD